MGKGYTVRKSKHIFFIAIVFRNNFPFCLLFFFAANKKVVGKKKFFK